MRTTLAVLVVGLLALGSGPIAALADQAEPLSALTQMPIKEVTVFKDGHAFVLHEGKMATDAAGNVLMDYLPTPVLGTFWPYSSDKNTKLTSVVASQRKVKIEQTALSLRELIEANVGAVVTVTEFSSGKETPSLIYEATIVGVPARSGEELEKSSPPNSGEKLPQKGNVVFLKTAAGTKVVAFDRIQDVTFKNEVKPRAANEEFRNLLTLKLDWNGKKAEKEVAVGMIYLQRGIRWIPEYKVTLDGKGNATVKLEATLINELADLEDVTAQLVVGVPTFAFKDQVDPISLQQTLAQLSPLFRSDSRMAMTSNAIMSQVARQDMAESAARPAAIDLGPEVAGSQRSEDLFVYTVKHITLKKGQRMVLPVNEVNLKYKDVFAVDIPFTPPPELQRERGGSEEELARLMRAPKAVHKIRLINKSEYPLTTAPALILSGDRVLAQGLMTYTSIGGDSDLPITTAVDVKVKKSDKETNRVPNAETWQKVSYGRVELAGTITLTNYRTEPVTVEVMRYVLGNVTEAANSGKIEMVNVFEDTAYASGGDEGVRPYWWGWYNWPFWWFHFNGVGKVRWDATIEPGKSVDLTYSWNYYAR
jgi:hypothetical protein